MNKINSGVVAILASAMLGSAAIAADMPAPLTKAPPPLPTWTGWYIGINGAGFSSVSNNIGIAGTDTGTAGLGAALAAGAIPAPINLQYNGWLLGGTIGYNWQLNPLWVVGLEGDFDGGKAKSTFATTGTPITTSAVRELDDLGLVRARLGMTVLAPLVTYVTGGLAFGERKLGIGAVDPAVALPPLSAFNEVSNLGVGWTVGGGLEYMFGPHWSFKGEFVYVDLGRTSSTISYSYPGNTSSLTATVRDHEEIVLAGVNYRF